jgi:hypothetical protein
MRHASLRYDKRQKFGLNLKMGDYGWPSPFQLSLHDKAHYHGEIQAQFSHFYWIYFKIKIKIILVNVALKIFSNKDYFQFLRMFFCGPSGPISRKGTFRIPLVILFTFEAATPNYHSISRYVDRLVTGDCNFKKWTKVHKSPPRDLYCKTYYDHNFCRIVISLNVCFCRSLPPYSSIISQGWSLSKWSHLL